MADEELLSFDEAIAAYTKAGWKITSDGPSGVQMEAPKKMRGLDKAALTLGILTFWIYGIGLLFIGVALIDYLLLTKPETRFFQRGP